MKEKKSTKEIIYWLVEFHQTVNKASGNQYLQFNAEILTKDKELTPSAKKDKVQILANEELPFLDMKISCPPEGD